MNIKWHYDNKCDWSDDNSIIYYDPDIDIALSFRPSYSLFLDYTYLDDLPDNITPYDYYIKEFGVFTNNENKFYCYVDENEIENPWEIFDHTYITDSIRSDLLTYIEKNNLLKTSKNAIKAYRHVQKAQEGDF